MARRIKRCFDFEELPNAAMIAHSEVTGQTMTETANEAFRVLHSVGALSFMRVCLPDTEEVFYSLETGENVLLYAIHELHGFKVHQVYSRFQFGVQFSHYKGTTIYHRLCVIPNDAELIA